MWEWLKTVSLLKSEFTNDISRPRKLINTNKNCKKTKEIIFKSNFWWLLKFLIEKKNIRNDKPRPKTKE